MRKFAACLLLLSTAALAGEPPSNDPTGVDKSVLPEELTVFMAQAHEVGPWPENVISEAMDKAGIPNLEWLTEADTGLKICRRSYVYIQDKETGVTPGMTKEQGEAMVIETGTQAIPLHPDATKPFVCARLGMMTPQLAPGTKWWNYKTACPQRILDEDGQTKFAEPDCPSDCHCIDEPVGL